MTKALVIFMIILIVLTSCPMRGDVNRDGKIDALDLLLCQQIAIGVKTPTVSEFYASDMNRDGVVNTRDVAIIKQMLLR